METPFEADDLHEVYATDTGTIRIGEDNDATDPSPCPWRRVPDRTPSRQWPCLLDVTLDDSTLCVVN